MIRPWYLLYKSTWGAGPTILSYDGSIVLALHPTYYEVTRIGKEIRNTHHGSQSVE